MTGPETISGNLKKKSMGDLSLSSTGNVSAA
jgi:hypothetical protein